MHSVNQIAATYLGRAKKEADPQSRAQIFRQAAAEFGRLAADPRNAKQKEQLTAIGLQFAGASQSVFGPIAPGLNHDRAVDVRSAHALENLYPEGMEHAFEQHEGPSIGTPVHVSVQPATFTKETTLGRSAPITAMPTPDQIAIGIKANETVAFWQGTKEEAQAMSIDLGITLQLLPTIPTKGLINRPFARVQYGSDGNTTNEVFVDVGLGKRITVVGNYISVGMGMDPPPVGAQSSVMQLGASIGTFAAPSVAPVVRSVYADGLVAGVESAPFPIPLRATRLVPPLPLPTFNDTILIRFLSNAGTGTLGVWQCTYSLLNPFQVPVPIPSGSYFFSIQSANGGTIVVPFELAL